MDRAFEPADEERSWEVIDPQEVEAVVAALDALIEQVESDTVRVYLHAACEDLSSLVDSSESDAERP